MFSADATETALEAMAMKANGAGMVADDEQRVTYVVFNGMGRGRGTTTGGLQALNSWTCAMGISTERGLLARLQAEGADTKSGVQSRVFTVNYDGAEVPDKTDDSELLAAYDVLAHGGVYGVAWEPFAERLLELGVDAVQERVSAYEVAWGVNVNGGERVVTTGALLAVASEICQEAGLFPANDFNAEWGEDGNLGTPGWAVDKMNIQMLLNEALDDTLAQRAGVLDTTRQASDTLRLEIIKAIGRGQIIDTKFDAESYSGILGYWINGKGVKAGDDDEEITAAMLARTYVLPVDRLHALGVKTDVAALVDQLRGFGALVLAKEGSKLYDKGLWQGTPCEGSNVNIHRGYQSRVVSAWVQVIKMLGCKPSKREILGTQSLSLNSVESSFSGVVIWKTQSGCYSKKPRTPSALRVPMVELAKQVYGSKNARPALHQPRNRSKDERQTEQDAC